MHTYAAPPRVKCSSTARAKLPRALPVCAQLKMVLGDMTNKATTAAHPTRTANKVNSKQMDDGNARDHENSYSSCDNPSNNRCAGTQPIATEPAAALAAARAAAALAAAALAAAADPAARLLQPPCPLRAAAALAAGRLRRVDESAAV